MTLTLFCIPHAGGTAALYRKWPGLLTGKAGVRALELPGRGARAREPQVPDFEHAVADLTRQIRAEPGVSDCALFGHSLGGLLAYEVARQLTTSPEPALRSLIISGCVAPTHRSETAEPAASSDELLCQIGELGMLPAEIADDPEAVAYFAGIVAADLKLLEGYPFRAVSTPLTCAVSALFGSDDPMTAGQDDRGWAAVTGRPVSVQLLAGAGHAYVCERAEMTAMLVAAELENPGDGNPGNSRKPSAGEFAGSLLP
ncbi:MAG TPA: alpha/beta fold hydrolase [Kineosporiaceae bacterium]|nr:alpha/beta fold hydrolase [Kineosporiaceae bacterium]